jgi:hypothetical protein
MCGIVRRQPKATPDAASIKLFGPGVIDETKAKLTSGSQDSAVFIAAALQILYRYNFSQK